MGSSDLTDYCAFTKAVEHLGDRWSLLIVRELAAYGPQGFSALATGLPGHISRSVLADRLRRLEELGLVARTERRGRNGPYRLTTAGNDFVPTLMSLRGWAENWLPDDPAMAEREPAIVLSWLGQRIDPSRLPERAAVIEVTMRQQRELHGWLVVEQGIEPYACLEDPLLDDARYVYVEAGAGALIALARGRQSWSTAIADGSVATFGDPGLRAELPHWFRDPDGVSPPALAIGA